MSDPDSDFWTPTPKERALGIGLVSFLGGLAPVLLEIPGHVGHAAAGVCAALALGIAAFLGMKSGGTA